MLSAAWPLVFSESAFKKRERDMKKIILSLTVILILEICILFSANVIKLEAAETVFVLLECNKSNYLRWVKGTVPEGVDLSNDQTARAILADAERFAWEKCPAAKKYNVIVELYQNNKRVVRARSSWGDVLRDDIVPPVWREYWNEAYQKRLDEEKAKQRAQAIKEMEDKRRLEAEKIRVAEEKKRAEVRNRHDDFAKKYGVKEWPKAGTLSANPFVYEGKTVAIAIEFGEMLSPTEGILAEGNNFLVVSNIPKGLFTSAPQHVVLAGSVLGKKEIKLPVLGVVSVPHLKFVGVYFCKNRQCSDMIFR
jgi:hypothetical protein